jgi:hypothetical protein
MNVYGRLLAHDRKPVSTKTGHPVYGVTTRSWRLRPFHKAIKRQTGPLHRSPEAKTDPGARPAGTIDLHIHTRVSYPGPGSELQSP